jgi:hypothetical protein
MRRQPEKDRHVRRLEQGSKNGAARMGQAEQDCKKITASTGLLKSEARAGQKERTAEGQPEQDI